MKEETKLYIIMIMLAIGSIGLFLRFPESRGDDYIKFNNYYWQKIPGKIK